MLLAIKHHICILLWLTCGKINKLLVTIFLSVEGCKHREHHNAVYPNAFWVYFPLFATTQVVQAIKIESWLIADVMKNLIGESFILLITASFIHCIGNKTGGGCIGLVNRGINLCPMVAIGFEKGGVIFTAVFLVKLVEGIAEKCLAPHPFHFWVPGGCNEVCKSFYLFIIFFLKNHFYHLI